MPRSVALLRGLWVALMVLLAVLMLTGSIAGVWTALYGLVVLTVVLAERWAARSHRAVRQ